MPGQDGTGPLGYGPRTGRRLGNCTHYSNAPENNEGPIYGLGRGGLPIGGEGFGLGGGHGPRFGAGRGFGRRIDPINLDHQPVSEESEILKLLRDLKDKVNGLEKNSGKS